MQKLPDKVLALIHTRLQYRPSDYDSNFNFVHQEDVFVIADLAYSVGKEECAAKTLEAQPETAGHTLEGVAPTTTQGNEIVRGCDTCGGCPKNDRLCVYPKFQCWTPRPTSPVA
jgi:hypothetical protein